MKAYEIVAANGNTFGPYTYEDALAMAEQWDQDEPDAAPHVVIEVER